MSAVRPKKLVSPPEGQNFRPDRRLPDVVLAPDVRGGSAGARRQSLGATVGGPACAGNAGGRTVRDRLTVQALSEVAVALQCLGLAA